jgi:6-pyruvoyltetrahydropterin/6-carboxytetrahydropterin synthase
MKFELRQQFQIESARFLPNLPPTHPCAQMHGHSFVLTLRWVGNKDAKIGWVRDYHEVSEMMTPLLKQLDHQVLNNVPGLENPTSENLAEWLYEKIKAKLPELIQVGVAETATTECLYPA